MTIATLLAGTRVAVRRQSALDGFNPNANGSVRVVDQALAPKKGAKTAPTKPNGTIAELGDAAFAVADTRIGKLSAEDGTIRWSMNLANDRALAVDPVDLSVYTGNGSHGFGGAGTVYKYGADGSFGWTNTISHAGGCNFYFVSGAAVDATSANPGVVWTETGCFGGFAKTTRDTGGQQWSSNANDIGRASIDPVNGQIYAITNSHYNTIYSVTANGGNVSSTSSCEGYTDLNPADGMLYRGGNAASNGCGLTLYQVNKSNLTMPNWSMDLSAEITSFDSLAVQPWSCGYIYIGSTADSKIVVVDPATQTVVTRFNTAIGPARIAVNPINGNL